MVGHPDYTRLVECAGPYRLLEMSQLKGLWGILSMGVKMTHGISEVGRPVKDSRFSTWAETIVQSEAVGLNRMNSITFLSKWL